MKDQRYKVIKPLIESNAIQNFKDIFTIIPVSTVKDDMKVNYNTLRRKIQNVELLTVKDIKGLSKLFGVSESALFHIVLFDNGNKKK
ncbi:hypothetical protein ACI6Q2_18335 [Chitinophagaceae bacterium LWZ2-11]